MRNSIKAALAATAGGALLLGGAGSLAYWTDSETLPGGTVDAGSLALTSEACGLGWVLNGELATFAFDRPLVPGDELVKVCSYVVDATGAYLEADITETGPTFNAANDFTAELTFLSEATLDAVAAPVPAEFVLPGEITSANDGEELIVTLTVDFDFTSATNLSNNAAEYGGPGLEAVLDSYVISATQTNATP